MRMGWSICRASAVRTARLVDLATDRAPNAIVLRRLIQIKEALLTGRARTKNALRADREMRKQIGALDRLLNANAEPARVFRCVAELERILADRERTSAIPKAEANRRAALQRMRSIAEEIAMTDEYAREIAARAGCEEVAREEFRSNRARARMLRRMLDRLRVQARNLDGAAQVDEEIENVRELLHIAPDPDAFEQRVAELLVREENFDAMRARMEEIS